MKQALTFTPPILSSTESKLNVEAFDASVEAFENHEYLKSFYALLDYINGDFRTKYGNVQGNEFHIPHGSIIVNIKLDEEKLSITAPFVALPEKGRIPLLRQVAGLNFNAMDLATIYLRDNRLSFEYSCPIQLINPYKIYYILQEICCTGDKYDDEFETKFGAQRIYEPKTTPYDTASLENIYQAVQISCKECLDAVKYFEPSRKYGYIWNRHDPDEIHVFRPTSGSAAQRYAKGNPGNGPRRYTAARNHSPGKSSHRKTTKNDPRRTGGRSLFCRDFYPEQTSFQPTKHSGKFRGQLQKDFRLYGIG